MSRTPLCTITPINDFVVVVMKAITDQEFREALVRDVDATLREAEFTLSPEQIRVLTQDSKPEEWSNITVDELDERLKQASTNARGYAIGAKCCS